MQAVKDWPSPTNLRELKSFIGLASYYVQAVCTQLLMDCCTPVLLVAERQLLYLDCRL